MSWPTGNSQNQPPVLILYCYCYCILFMILTIKGYSLFLILFILSIALFSLQPLLLSPLSLSYLYRFSYPGIPHIT